MNNNITWHKIADDLHQIEWQPNNMAVALVNGKKLTLVKFSENNLAACAHKCPHASGTMADGYIDALQNIVCPLHRYKFSLSNGKNTSGEGYYLKTYPIEIRNDGVFVGMQPTGLFNWL
jgi:3-phenylpropionate/trans-cinnamate dioxygenase ferredoxin subunit